MSYDALVWLLVGLGIGVAGSLMLLLGYSMLEYGRLSRRFREARAAVAAAATPDVAVVPPAPRTSLLARPVAGPVVETKPVAKVATEVKPTVTPRPTAEAKPARPALAVVPKAGRQPAELAKAAPPVAVEAKPAAVSASKALSTPLPKRPQSVDAIFAEAFAHDRLTVLPEPDETAAAKPEAGKPPA
ncbi:MAG TPA: hypothetical protein VGV07_21765 [Devosia sp.]|jgi:hypothetical protein|uniref:hypothetical protein n=1 Tax=Devosia sp. TaxID=1871048 RepID=UPI002DDD02CC|nr:hypothetical protein [Devosia sp.]HEV2517894.1 hypothetical protein [Devosia sp.]